MSNLMTRAIFGGVYLGILICAVLFYSQIAFLVFGVMAALGLMEYNKLLQPLGYENDQRSYLIIGVLIYVLFALAGMNYISALWWGVLPLFAMAILVYSLFQDDKNAVLSAILGLGGYLYILLPFILIHFLYAAKTDGEILDYWPVLGMMILTWTSDTFAYLTGRFIGKTKLFERISPKKTWEGVMGGVAFSLLASYLISIFDDNRSLLFWMVLGLIVPVFGILGDLFESLIKRTAGVKDSGNLIPGHGGILDRIDAMLFTVPATFSWIFIFQLIK
ncbi:MAG: phosphatidate cytidylyltransferase [Crocinitomicaceae bacterium]|nr:phosphatidate cytidylyltransferase [Crocinitomicaceae bacterium]